MSNHPTTLPGARRALYQLVQDRMEVANREDKTTFLTPLGFILYHRRVDETQTEPIPFRKIAIWLTELTGVDVTHESVRRWYRVDHPAPQPTP